MLFINGERYMVERTWNGKTVQVRRRGVKKTQSLRPSEISEFVELYNLKYGYSAKHLDDVIKEPFDVKNQWVWNGNTFTLTPISGSPLMNVVPLVPTPWQINPILPSIPTLVADTVPAFAENDPSLPPIPPVLLG